MSEEPQPLEYARPPDARPDLSNLPAYKRYSPTQLAIRWVLALLIAVTIFVIIPRILMGVFNSAWR